MKKYISLLCFSLLLLSCAEEQKKEVKSSPQEQFSKIDRQAVIARNNIQINQLDTLASLSVGNGAFAFTTDVTGLQTFPDNFIFEGSKESVRKQIGMAVPVKGAKILFDSILKTFEGIDYPSIDGKF